MKYLRLKTILIFLISILSRPGWAGDRVLEVQSRVTAALSGILPKTDYMVVVNKIDSLDNMGGQVVNGVIRNLPGLRVGVDEDGQVVIKDGQQQAFSGPISLTVVIDSKVANGTYRAIETLLPEIMGGSRGGDEIKLKKAELRQEVEDPAPQVVINNAAPQIDPKAISGSNEFYRMGALFLVGLGAILWMISRKQSDQPSKSLRSAADPYLEPRRNNTKQDGLPADGWEPKIFESFDSEIVGLYILKCVQDGDIDKARSFFSASSPLAQKTALSSIPGWCASYCVDALASKENMKLVNQVDPETILREMSVMERALKVEAAAKASALIQWIPVEAMAKVHPESLASPSDNTRYAIISMRPDLAKSFRYDEHDALVSGLVYSAKAIIEAAAEMNTWRSNLVMGKSSKVTVIEAMAGIVNQLETFIEIEVKLLLIKEKMSNLDWEEMQSKIVTAETFEKVSDLQKKDFLRIVEPADFQYVRKTLGYAANWPIDSLLRPKRLAAFRKAERMNAHVDWTKDEQRDAGARVLKCLRISYLGEQQQQKEQSGEQPGAQQKAA